MRKIAISAAAITSIALLAGMWAGPVPGPTDLLLAGGETDMPANGPHIAGTWYSTAILFDPNGVPIPGADINVLATYTFKGGVTTADTSDFGGHPLINSLDSAGHGAWSLDGNALTTVSLALTYDEKGVSTGTLRLTVNQVYDPQNPNVAVGTWFTENFGPGEDPLGPPRQPSGGGSVISRRLVVGG